MADSNILQASYSSFSGADIHATFRSVRIGALQGISYTVTREKAPIYTMGDASPRGFSRGKRGIAGSLIFAVFDRTNLLYALGEDTKFWADAEDVSRDALLRERAADVSGPRTNPQAELAEDPTGDLRNSYRLSYAFYHDQIPPFDVVLTAMNETGNLSRMKILGVEILNAGSGVSIDDITTDENMTFVARDIIPWTPIANVSLNKPLR